MDRQAVDSTNLRSVGYEDGVLEIEFLSGAVYQYTGDGTRRLYNRLLRAPSVGSFFELNIAHNPGLKATKVQS